LIHYLKVLKINGVCFVKRQSKLNFEPRSSKASAKVTTTESNILTFWKKIKNKSLGWNYFPLSPCAIP